MHDIKTIRDQPTSFDSALGRRGLSPMAPQILRLDEERRSIIARLQTAQERRNAASKEIGAAKAARDEARARSLMDEVAALKQDRPALEADERRVEAELTALLAAIPNLPAAEVPDGRDESGNVERHRWGTPKTFDFAPKQHFELGEALGQMDFETAAKISGARFVVLKGQLAQLERALAQFMLDIHTSEHGYTETNPPLLVRQHTAYGTGNLPKFAEDLFHVSGDFWLTPTAEVSVTNYVRDDIQDEAKLPYRYTAHTPCFRSEAGSAGRDTRGMIRAHQFMKVELVSITAPEQSDSEHERMLNAAETILRRLELPFRTITLCTGDMGFAARKTYDIEVWLPGQNAYREISSCSNCGDFQARRMNARYRPMDGKGAPRFVHTLNGSGVAVGRCLVAVMENYQHADGSIVIPEALRPYMGGRDMIIPAS